MTNNGFSGSGFGGSGGSRGFGGQSYGGQGFGGQSYGGQSYGGQGFGGQSYGGQSYGGQSYGGQSYGGQNYGSQGFGGYGGQNYGGQNFQNYQPPAQQQQHKRAKAGGKLAVWTMVATALVGAIVCGLLCLVIYRSLNGVIPTVWLDGIMFGTSALLTVGTVLIFAFASGHHGLCLFTDDCNPGLTIGLAVGGIVLVFGLASLFQWIYGLEEGSQTGKATSYVFMIDDSWSMTTAQGTFGETPANDPDNQRYEAINVIMDGQSDKFPYAVYSFADDVVCTRQMQPTSAGSELGEGTSGQTNFLDNLNSILDDFDAGEWTDCGKAPRIVLLTDGESISDSVPDNELVGSSEYVEIINRAEEAGITISTVGLGDVNDDFLQSLADDTGGVYVHIEDADELSESMSTAAHSVSTRDLVYGGASDIGHELMRVGFIMLLSIALGFACLLAYGNIHSLILTLATSAGSGLLAGLVGQFASPLLPAFVWLPLMMLLFCICFLITPERDWTKYRRLDTRRLNY